MEEVKVLKLKLKVIERRMCALERAVEVLIDRGDLLEYKAKMEEWY
jgi:hypothetical protein